MPIWNSEHVWDEQSKGLKLFRGFPIRVSEETVTFGSPEERTPVNMPPLVQLEIDNWFEARFGVRFRQRSIFSTGSLDVARDYARDTGEVRALRPLADFCFCWSPLCGDLYGAYMDSHSSETIPTLLGRLEFRCDDIHSALLSENEVMLVCSSVQATTLFNAKS
ncbi:hypothetical protein [Acidovorax sp. K2F]|uniref:hypothetical protein n=1 Tax=Acidovorax sp. K2F TaxID=2978125 RepID=UPI0021B0E2D9|nr:hypothetical protein [Acidovorax sp. K2F]MCT6717231.1 hypothetical protein [Acidovorax sp. K2F]